ncbi:unnamed protein product [Lupinus luteus]|uniref:Thioredoxin domain-containing protein n=1 Tax=Lupinus luteus TaxID=3873 RepID=A0AAV1WLC9_LUPLU
MPKTEEVKKELTERDVHEGFDLSLTKHKGQASPTCGPCRMLKPILSKVIDEYDQNVHYIEIDIEEDPEVAEAVGIMGTPCVQFFKNKEMISSSILMLLEPGGVKMKREYKEFIEANK